MNQTANVAEPINGAKLYQERARKALPLLVRQAESGRTIFYSDLAEELGMPNPRNLNYPLGCIGLTLHRLSRAWKERVPVIQCLVINKNNRLPGEGVGWFLNRKDEFAALSRLRQKEKLQVELERIFAYPRWRDVLESLSLPYARPDFSGLIRQASSRGEGGESADHRRLKEFVARNPASIGLPPLTASGITEFALPSGDSLDVSFHIDDKWIAAEVKSIRSDAADITRGLFQCVSIRL